MVRRLFFYRVLALYIEFSRHLISLIGREIGIERFVISGNATPYTGGMGGKDGRYLGHMLPHIQQPKSCHPFVPMIHHPLGSIQLGAIKAFHYPSGSIWKHRCLVVIAVAMQTIHLIKVPKLCIELVFLSIERLKIHQNGNGLSRNIPTPQSHTESFLLDLLLPSGKKGIIG